jgi:hypothetical protein
MRVKLRSSSHLVPPGGLEGRNPEMENMQPEKHSRWLMSSLASWWTRFSVDWYYLNEFTPKKNKIKYTRKKLTWKHERKINVGVISTSATDRKALGVCFPANYKNTQAKADSKSTRRAFANNMANICRLINAENLTRFETLWASRCIFTGHSVLLTIQGLKKRESCSDFQRTWFWLVSPIVGPKLWGKKLNEGLDELLRSANTVVVCVQITFKIQ